MRIMHLSRNTLRATCDHCGGGYRRKTKWQRYCSDHCRRQFHNEKKKTHAGPQGEVTIVCKLRDGGASVTIHFVRGDAGCSWKLEVGDVVQIVATGERGQVDSSATAVKPDT